MPTEENKIDVTAIVGTPEKKLEGKIVIGQTEPRPQWGPRLKGNRHERRKQVVLMRKLAKRRELPK